MKQQPDRSSGSRSSRNGSTLEAIAI